MGLEHQPLNMRSCRKIWPRWTNAQWRGKVVIALPLFGSTATHFQVLRQQWEGAMARLVPGVEGERRDDRGRQSVVVQLVGRGEVALGLTDFDDVRAGLKNGCRLPSISHFDGFSIRNSVGYVAGSPRPALAKRLAKHLQSQPVIDALVAAGALDPGTPGASATIDLARRGC